MTDFAQKNKNRRVYKDRCAGQTKKYLQARAARRAVKGAFGRADESDYTFMAFGTAAGSYSKPVKKEEE